MAARDFRTPGIVLRRTNYGEADRILNVITPDGKISVIAKGARKEKSRLAGGIEMFSLVNLNVHQGKSDLGVVTCAKMVKYYQNILKDYERMELAAIVLRRINAASEHTDNPDFFEIARQVLEELDSGVGLELAEGWFWLKLLRASGTEMNLYRDAAGAKLVEGARYNWNVAEEAFVLDIEGEYGTDEIKLLRLATMMDLSAARKIKTELVLWGKVLDLVRIVAKY
ncbi:MAG: DNA repair protein RecO [Candidatus Saccharibacteria bacterium]|nr:DNA repair protein RecO [Candidatus Saccharibacteria bacterium]